VRTQTLLVPKVVGLAPEAIPTQRLGARSLKAKEAAAAAVAQIQADGLVISKILTTALLLHMRLGEASEEAASS